MVGYDHVNTVHQHTMDHDAMLLGVLQGEK